MADLPTGAGGRPEWRRPIQGRRRRPRPTSSRSPSERRGRTLRRIAAFFRPYRLQVAVVLVAILVTSLLGLVNPYLLKLLIDDAIPQRDWACSTCSSG